MSTDTAAGSGVTAIRPPRWYYDRMSTRQKQCRGRRFHKFPDLDPTADRLPDGFRVLFHDDLGNYYLQETCECCGRRRFSVNLWDNGHFRRVSPYRYADADDGEDEWVHVPHGVITAAMIREFLQDDCSDLILAAGEASRAALSAAASSALATADR